MRLTSLFAQAVALVGQAAIAVRRLQGKPPAQALGEQPTIPAGRPPPCSATQ